jgi:hypothetical protein
VNHDIAIEGPDIADAALAPGLELDGHAGGGDGLGLGHGQNLLPGVLGERGKGELRAGGGDAAGRRCRIGQRLRTKLEVTEGQQRDKH